jgi:putative transposase
MRKSLSLTELTEEERQQALARYQLLQPFLDGQTSLTNIAKTQKQTLRTLQRWVRRYRCWGLTGLARQRRSDAGRRSSNCAAGPVLCLHPA